MLEIRTFGGLSLEVNGQPIRDMGSRKAEALLAYLAVEGRQQNRNVLAALFWPESPEDHAATSLRVALSILRKKLGAYLDISRDTVGIKPDARIYLDLSDLARKLARGDVEQALEIYQGDFLQGSNVRDSSEFEDWLRLEQERVRGSIISALHMSTSRAIEAGEYAKGQTFVKRLLELDPLDEMAYQQYILLLALDGERTAALAQYEKCCAILQAELGARPSVEMQELHEQILQGEIPASLGLAIPEHNLPAPQTSFVGREEELVKIGTLIQDPACRLLTLVGPGGSGKTRLALQAATKALRSFSDGVYFVPLELIYSADYLIPSIANALLFDIDTFATQLDPKTQLLDYLQKRSILFVMDGFEHLADNAGLLSEMLDHAPKVKVLVTSRQRLGLKAEWTFLVVGLPAPPNLNDAASNDSDAMRLFIQRAQQAKTDFRLSEGDIEYAAHICQLVEGMPLGIELAAAWTSVLFVKEIAGEMEKGLDFLATSMRDIPEKHRSLRAVFDSSWLLLTDEQQQTFSKLSVFRGGFDLQAAMQVTGANLQQLSALLDKSLLRRDEAGHFTMHSLIRQFAAEKLNQLPGLQEEVHTCFCRYYMNMLTQREADFMGPRMLEARDEIRHEMDNIHAAVNWVSLHWEAQPARKVLITLLCFYIVQGWHEGILAFRDIARLRRDALPAGYASDPAKDPVILSARIHQAFLQTNLGQIEESETISSECLEALRELGLREELSECLHNLGVNASFRGEYKSARAHLEDAILLGRECDYVVWPSYLLWLGHLYFLLGEYEDGLLSLRKCRDLFDKRGTLWGTAFALSKMGLAADGLGEHFQAMKYHREALSIFERFGNQAGKGYSLSRMSMSAYFLEEYPQALQLGLEGYQTFEEIGHRWGMCTSLSRLGFAYIGLGDTGKAKGYFKNAFRISKQDKMLPLSLYALAGFACTLAQEGEEQTALELYRYVQQHPQTPALYLKEAARWISSLDQESRRNASRVASVGGETEAIEVLVDRLLD